MSRSRALIIDDEADIRALLEITLGRMGIDTDVAEDIAQARSRLAQNSYDLCLTDMRLPDGSGIEIVREIASGGAQTPVAVITAYGNIEDAVESLKAGAFDFVSKPVDIDDLRRLVETALRVQSQADSAAAETGRLLGNAPAIVDLRSTIDKLARSQAPVHICGESGTGKELVAGMIHAAGPRRSQAFVPVNCGAIPSELMETEFFGHVRGSFTGAAKDKAGLFAAAEGGTLFLDEVADLPLHMQVKLLRAIQERAVRPVGAEHEMPTDVRILSATHKPLAELVSRGEFRQDLYYRLNVIEVRVPPLRERREDIPLLCDALLAGIADRHGRECPRVDDDALAALIGHPFPGNVRELENVLERALTLCEGEQIEVADLGLMPAAAEASRPAEELPTRPMGSPDSIDDSLQQLERDRIEAALKQARYNKTQAAKLLGISFRSLRYRLKKLEIE